MKVRRLGKCKVKIPHQRSPYALKFEDRSPGEIARQERCARGDAWELARKIYKLKQEDKASFYSPSEEWILPTASTINSEEREFVADSGASMHMVSKKDFNKAELETVRNTEKSFNGSDSQRRGASKRRVNGIRQRIGFILDVNAS